MSKICRQCWTRFKPDRDVIAELHFCSGHCASRFLSRNCATVAVAVITTPKVVEQPRHIPSHLPLFHVG
jgi:hypothetical protein